MTTSASHPKKIWHKTKNTKKRINNLAFTTALLLAAGLVSTPAAHAVSGGTPAPANTNAYVVKVDTGYGTCTGTLINRLWVITAASCFSANPAEFATLTPGKPPRASKILVGTDATTHDKAGIPVLQIHPVPNELTRDIVLVELAAPVDTITPLKISTTAPQATEILSVVGYGRTTTEWVPNNPHTGDFRVDSLTESTVNLVPNSPETALCAGDGGAPGIRATPTGPELALIYNQSTQGRCLYSRSSKSLAIGSALNDLSDWITEVTSTESTHAASHLIKNNDVVAAGTDTLLRRYPSNGKTGLGMPAFIGAGWSDLKNGFIADWNADGVPDIVAQKNDGNLNVYPGSAQGYLQPINLGSTWKDWTLTVGRWKKTDKYPGIVGSDPTGKLIYLANLTGTTLEPGVIIGNGWSGLGLTMIDFDKDNNLDILAKNQAGELRLYRSNGASGFISETRPVVGRGWNIITNMNPIYDFAGPKSVGVLARDQTGKLRYYPLKSPRTWGNTTVFGQGWNPMTIFGQTPK